MDQQLAQLHSTLAASGAEFIRLSPLPKDIVHARFVGCFEGCEVVWDMQLYTLLRYRQEWAGRASESKISLRGLMKIEPVSNDNT